MSNEEALQEASRWLGTLQLGRDLTGKTVDLTPHLSTLTALAGMSKWERGMGSLVLAGSHENAGSR